MKRRHLLLGAAGTVLVRPAQSIPASLRKAIDAFTGGKAPREGRVTLDIASLVENGNVVPVKVSVASPMTAADHVTQIALFTESNPQPEVAVFTLGPVNARAEVGTRIRLATSQGVVAVAKMNDGSFWQQRVDVIVTLAACVEGG